MSSKFIPNSYQTPNALVDELMPLLKPEEWVVASYAIRHILGWQDRFITRRAKLSLSHFVDGVSGNPFAGGCGLSRGAVSAALERLVEFGLLKRIGEPTPEGQEYELDFENVDMDKLCEAKAQRDIKAAQKMAGLRQRKQDKKTTPVYTIDQSIPQTDPSLCDRPTPVYAIDTIKDTLQTHIQKQSTSPATQDDSAVTLPTTVKSKKQAKPPTPRLLKRDVSSQLVPVLFKYGKGRTLESFSQSEVTTIMKNQFTPLLKALQSLDDEHPIDAMELDAAYKWFRKQYKDASYPCGAKTVATMLANYRAYKRSLQVPKPHLVTAAIDGLLAQPTPTYAESIDITDVRIIGETK